MRALAACLRPARVRRQRARRLQEPVQQPRIYLCSGHVQTPHREQAAGGARRRRRRARRQPRLLADASLLQQLRERAVPDSLLTSSCSAAGGVHFTQPKQGPGLHTR